MLRLKDVARIELGAYSYEQRVTLDGQPTIAMGVFLQTGANALEVAEQVRSKMQALQQKFPPGMGLCDSGGQHPLCHRLDQGGHQHPD